MVDNASSWLRAAYAASPLLFWALGSALVYSLAAHLRWLVRARSFVRSLPARTLSEAGRFLFFLGVPYLVLGGWPRQPYQGLLSPQELGLVGLSPTWPVTRWLEAAGTGVGIGFVALIVLGVAWRRANRALDGPALPFSPRPAWLLLVDILYLEVHWAFYRAALGGALDSAYGGIFLGLGLVYLEWGLDPFWRRGWRRRTLVAGRWLRAALALVTTVLFLLTRNLWVCLAVHCLLELTFWYGGRHRGAPQIA